MSFDRIKFSIEQNVFTLAQLNEWLDTGLKKIKQDGFIDQDELKNLEDLIEAKIIELSQ